MQDNQMLVLIRPSRPRWQCSAPVVDEWLWKELKALVASMPASWFKYGLTNLIQEIEAAR